MAKSHKVVVTLSLRSLFLPGWSFTIQSWRKNRSLVSGVTTGKKALSLSLSLTRSLSRTLKHTLPLSIHSVKRTHIYLLCLPHPPPTKVPYSLPVIIPPPSLPSLPKLHIHLSYFREPRHAVPPSKKSCITEKEAWKLELSQLKYRSSLPPLRP